VGEWSEYFEDFPEENPSNWINGRFDPDGAARARVLEAQQRAQKGYAQAELDAELKRIVEKHRQPKK
jgi:hypothetical protein